MDSKKQNEIDTWFSFGQFLLWYWIVYGTKVAKTPNKRLIKCIYKAKILKKWKLLGWNWKVKIVSSHYSAKINNLLMGILVEHLQLILEVLSKSLLIMKKNPLKKTTLIEIT